jgi:HEPN domain-containing protein
VKAFSLSEKALKALHYRRGARMVLGHSLIELLNDLLSDHPTLRDLGDAARQLDQYYIPARYPNGLPGGVPAEVFTSGQATEAVNHAREFVVRARTILGDRPH